jgi:multiple antibiotic resistance protein
MVTVLLVAIAFVIVGMGIFMFLNITVADFMIAGGTLLFIISIRNILVAETKTYIVDPDIVGVVPLITGPAVY